MSCAYVVAKNNIYKIATSVKNKSEQVYFFSSLMGLVPNDLNRINVTKHISQNIYWIMTFYQTASVSASTSILFNMTLLRDKSHTKII